MFASIKNLFANLIASAKVAPAHKCDLKFRIVFVSPFFELEVDAGNGWHTVHSQVGQVLQDSITIYPILRFTSFADGIEYATGLGLTNMNSKSMFGMYRQPPASYEKEAAPRIMQPQYIVDGKSVKPSQVQEPAHQVPAFTVFNGTGDQSKEVKAA